MTQHFLTVNSKTFHESLRKPHIIKTYSFTTDDDDAGSVSRPSETVTNHVKLISMNSPSIDSYNGDSSENNKKPYKRKSKRQSIIDNHFEKKLLIPSRRSWYNNIANLMKLSTVVIVIILVYFMWIKRDIMIDRLLTSDARLRRYGVKNNDQIESSSTVDSSPQEDIIENTEEKNEDDEEFKPRIRKTKKNFINETRKKKQRRSRNSTNSSSTKTKNQNRSLITRQSTPIHLYTPEDILEQIRKNLKSRRRQRDFISKLSKSTNLRKDQLYRFIYKKDYKIINLQAFVTILDSFNLMLLIVPK